MPLVFLSLYHFFLCELSNFFVAYYYSFLAQQLQLGWVRFWRVASLMRDLDDFKN
jgi:hypothetical protein